MGVLSEIGIFHQSTIVETATAHEPTMFLAMTVEVAATFTDIQSFHCYILAKLSCSQNQLET